MSEYVETPQQDSSEFTETPVQKQKVNIQRNNAMDEGAYSASKGIDPEPVVTQKMSEEGYIPPTPEFMKEDYLGRYLSDVENRVSGAVRDGVDVDVDKVSTSIETAVRASDGAYGEARAYIEAQPQSIHLSDEEKDRAAVMYYMKRQSSEVMDDMGVMDWVSDIGSMIVAPDFEDYRMSRVAELVGMDFTAKDALDPTDFLGRMSTKIRSLPPQDAIKAVDSIVEGWPDIMGDNRLMLTILMSELTGDYTEDMKQIENYLGKTDKASWVVPPLMLAKNIYKSLNAVNAARKAGNVEALTAMVNKGTDGALVPHGVDIEDAASTAMPLKSTDGLIPGSSNGLAPEIMKQNEEVGIYLDAVDQVNSFGLGLTEVERTEAIGRGIKKLTAREEVTDVEVVSKDSVSFTLKYKQGDTDVTQETSFLVDDTGSFIYKQEEGQYMGVNLGIVSPNTRFTADKKSLVQLPEQMQFQSAQIRHLYDKAIRKAYAPDGKQLSAKEHAKLDDLLLKGDKAEKEWTAEELMMGVDGIKYSEREAKAYTGMRQVVDHMYAAKDKQLVEQLKAKGVKITTWKGMDVPVRVYDEAGSAVVARSQTATHSKMVGIQNKDGDIELIDDLTSDQLHDFYARGYKLSRATNGKFLNAGSTNVEWGLVKADDFREPSFGVLGHRTGYVPKVNKNGHFFLKENVPISVGGGTVKQAKTVRYFDNRADADTYMKQIDPDGKGDYHVVADRELSSSARDMEYTNISGGMFTGARKQEPIPFGLDGVEGERASALESLQRYVNHLAGQMPYNLYRMGLKQKWVNTAHDMGALKSGRTDLPFDELIADLDTKHKAYGFLQDSHKQVSLISGVPTVAEKAAQARTTAMALWFEKFGTVGKKVASKMHGKDIVDEALGQARSVTFHAMLGMYNPAQFAIQASGALVAISINPVLAMKALPRSMAYAVLDKVPLDKLDGSLAAMRAKGFDTEGYELWRKSGTQHSITSTNADYRSITDDAPYDAGLLRKIMANDAFFFKSGELVNARLSFATAYEHWKAANKGKKAGEGDLQTILARMEQYRLNMSKANSAGFQKGVASLPLQFQQVNTKFMEKLLNTDLSKSEKARLVGMQAGFFGAMGIPFLNAFVPSAMNALGLNAEEASPEELNAWRNGVFGWYFNDYMDIDSVIGGRMTLGKDLFENVMKAASSQASAGDVLMGPSGNIYDKTLGNLPNFYSAMNTIAYADDVGIDKVAAVTEVLSRTLLDIPSSTASLVKAYDMTHSKFYKNKKGRPIFEWAGVTKGTVVAQALGFSPVEVQDWYEINNRKGGSVPMAVRNVDAGRIVRLMNDLHLSSESKKETVLFAISAIKNKYKPEDQQKIIEQVMAAIKEPKNSWEKAAMSVADEWTSELNDGLMSIYRNMKARTNPKLAEEFQKAGVNKTGDK